MRGCMSYCVNCGVELHAAAKECPLCNVPVVNPMDLKQGQGVPPFPEEKGQVETVKRKDLGLLITMVVLATAVTCGLLNVFVFNANTWSLAVIGVCVLLWVILEPVFIYTRQNIYVSILFDGIAIIIYLFMLACMVNKDAWFWQLGVPIVVLFTMVVEVFTFCVRNLPKSILTISLYVFTAIGVVCVGLESLIDFYIFEKISLIWSAVVLTVCVIIDIAIITLLSKRRLRNAVRRRLHF